MLCSLKCFINNIIKLHFSSVFFNSSLWLKLASNLINSLSSSNQSYWLFILVWICVSYLILGLLYNFRKNNFQSQICLSSCCLSHITCYLVNRTLCFLKCLINSSLKLFFSFTLFDNSVWLKLTSSLVNSFNSSTRD